MKKLMILAVALFSMTTTFAADENASATTATAAFNMNVNMNSLSDALGLNIDQVEAVADVHKNFTAEQEPARHHRQVAPHLSGTHGDGERCTEQKERQEITDNNNNNNNKELTWNQTNSSAYHTSCTTSQKVSLTSSNRQATSAHSSSLAAWV